MGEIVLSLFPGIGLLDRAFEEAGFCVVRGPDLLWGGDIRRFSVPRPGVFDGVVGGPPCQAFSALAHMARHNGYKVAENLIPEFERVVAEAQPRWFLMENVSTAPDPRIPGYSITSFTLNQRWVLGATEQHRVRRFWFGHVGTSVNLVRYIEFSALEPARVARAVLAAGALGQPQGKKRLRKRSASQETVREALRLQGLPDDFFGSDSPFTVAGMQRMLGNGVPLPLGRAVARAIRAALLDLEKSKLMQPVNSLLTTDN